MAPIGPSEVPGSAASGTEVGASPEPIAVIAAEPDQAWKALGLVNDWIKHAETKAGATLAGAGVTGGVLYNLVKGVRESSVLLNLAAVLCCSTVIIAGTCAAIGLVPRLRIKRVYDNPTSPLFFNHIARTYQDDEPTYTELLHALTSDRSELTRHIARQVHANATVANRKYKWVSRATIAFLGSLAFLAMTAAVIGIGSFG